MKRLTKIDISELDRRKRANLINSVSGYKPANLIGTIAADGRTNLAIFSSVVHLGADPPLIGFIMRPVAGQERHTYENIRETGVYTINHIHRQFAEKAHFTSAKFDRRVSEFAACGLTEEYIDDFAAPFVRESRIRIGLRLIEEIPVKINGTIMVIGVIEHLVFDETALSVSGNLDLNAVADICISGLDTYHEVKKLSSFSYADPDQLPDFEVS